MPGAESWRCRLSGECADTVAMAHACRVRADRARECRRAPRDAGRRVSVSLSWLLLLVLAVPSLHAASVDVEVGTLELPGWRAGELRVSLTPGEEGIALDIELSRFGPSRGGVSFTANARCSASAARPAILECPNIVVRTVGGGDDALRVDASGTVRLLSDGFELALPHFGIGAGVGTLQLTRRAERDTLELSLEALDAPVLAKVQRVLLPESAPRVNAGKVDLRVRLEQRSGRLRAFDLKLAARGVGFSDSAGLNAGENLAADARIRLAGDAGRRRLHAELRLAGGQVYVHPLYLDFATMPVEFSADGTPREDGGMALGALRLVQAGLFEATGSASLGADFVPERVRLDVERTPLAPAVAVWLQPWLPAELADGVETTGDFAAGISWDGGEDLGARLDLFDAGVRDARERFALQGLQGRLQWHSSQRRAVTLRLAQARLYRLRFGATRLIGEVEGRSFTLLAPLRVPLFGGALRVDSLHATGIGLPAFEVALAGELEPLDLAALASALDWPAFDGTLSGTLPALRYADGVLELGSALRTQVFDGEVIVDNLRIEDPLGVVPVLRADVRVSDISLAALTRAFSFGDVSGRLQGEVRGLVLRDWQPRAFDARFATPDNDRSEHRISQRAVNNLASIGGAAGALSTGFLGFFSEFSYDRLGLSCVLRNGVCRMGGVADANDGYYIVVGGGLPRIDIIGFNREVDWSVLVERLVQATRSEGPVVR